MKRRPVAAVLSCARSIDGMLTQSVSERFLHPIREISGLSVVVIPSLGDMMEARELADRFDALLLTGSSSNVSPTRYGSSERQVNPADPCRDATALAMASAMIDAGRTVFGICRGLQEINVLYGGTLHGDLGRAGMAAGMHHPEVSLYGEALATNVHPVHLAHGAFGSQRTVDVVSAHHQGIDALGAGLRVEATAPDGLVEAVSDFGTAAVLGVQWHPEWNCATCGTSRSFFEMFGRAARGERTEPLARAA